MSAKSSLWEVFLASGRGATVASGLLRAPEQHELLLMVLFATQ